MYEIPGFSKYYLGDDFKVYNKEHNRLISGSVDTFGYVRISLINDDNLKITMKEHQIVANTVIPKPDLVINHKDGIKSNNHPKNLEWCTNAENRFHAFNQGTIQINQFVQVKDNLRNEILFFNSIHQCSKYFNLNRTTIKARILKGPEKVYPGGLQFRSPATDEPFPVIADIEKSLLDFGTYKPTLVRNLDTGEITRFERQNDAATFMGVVPSNVTIAFNKSRQPVIKDIFQIKHETDHDDWLEPEIITAKVTVEVYNVLTNEVKIYDDAASAARNNNLKTTALHYRLNCNPDKVWPDGKKYRKVKKVFNGSSMVVMP